MTIMALSCTLGSEQKSWQSMLSTTAHLVNKSDYCHTLCECIFVKAAAAMTAILLLYKVLVDELTVRALRAAEGGKPGVACSVTGVGENIMRAMLARSVCTSAQTSSKGLDEVCQSHMHSDIINIPLLVSTAAIAQAS